MLSGILEHTGFMLPHQNAGMFNIRKQSVFQSLHSKGVCLRLLWKAFCTIEDQITQYLVKLLETPQADKVKINGIHTRINPNTGEYLN